MEKNQFHLSLGVEDLVKSCYFYENVTRAKVTHRDPSGYVNIDFYGCQITLKEGGIGKDLGPHFHFGANLSLKQFEDLLAHVVQVSPSSLVRPAETWDAGTEMERRKIYLRCPSGYLIEIKGYPTID